MARWRPTESLRPWFMQVMRGVDTRTLNDLIGVLLEERETRKDGPRQLPSGETIYPLQGQVLLHSLTIDLELEAHLLETDPVRRTERKTPLTREGINSAFDILIGQHPDFEKIAESMGGSKNIELGRRVIMAYFENYPAHGYYELSSHLTTIESACVIGAGLYCAYPKSKEHIRTELSKWLTIPNPSHHFNLHVTQMQDMFGKNLERLLEPGERERLMAQPTFEDFLKIFRQRVEEVERRPEWVRRLLVIGETLKLPKPPGRD